MDKANLKEAEEDDARAAADERKRPEDERQAQEKAREDARAAEAERERQMSKTIGEKLRGVGTLSSPDELKQEALAYIRLASDREKAFAEIIQSIDLARAKSRGRGR